jgi:hypothetical protein
MGLEIDQPSDTVFVGKAFNSVSPVFKDPAKEIAGDTDIHHSAPIVRKYVQVALHPQSVLRSRIMRKRISGMTPSVNRVWNGFWFLLRDVSVFCDKAKEEAAFRVLSSIVIPESARAYPGSFQSGIGHQAVMRSIPPI